VLKTVNNVPGLKRLVKALMGAGGQLLSVFYLLVFLLLLFGACLLLTSCYHLFSRHMYVMYH
jgi:hypothetical protein